MTVLVFCTIVIIVPGCDADVLQGGAVYERNCANCHGAFGKGDGPRAATMQIKAIDFTQSEVMEVISPKAFERMLFKACPLWPGTRLVTSSPLTRSGTSSDM
ncbi:MAG: hypothetical protein A2170_14645 [Deltaproteobacteria bacterium RBG_13_53_10]|nr:MAG: hypothetical protein A2170_14645 [Deltaproteobacteria bacterium RBG_13_53_10]